MSKEDLELAVAMLAEPLAELMAAVEAAGEALVADDPVDEEAVDPWAVADQLFGALRSFEQAVGVNGRTVRHWAAGATTSNNLLTAPDGTG